MNIKNQIYAVINRRYNENLNTTKVLGEKCGESSVAAALFGAAAKEDYELLSFLDTLPEQPVEGLEEEIEMEWDSFNKHLAEYDDGTDEVVWLNLNSFEDIARHFAEWGAKHTKK